VIESGATHAGGITGIVVGAVRDVPRELGDWATDVFEIHAAGPAGHYDAPARAELQHPHP
jgi:hypothetical protein